MQCGEHWSGRNGDAPTELSIIAGTFAVSVPVSQQQFAHTEIEQEVKNIRERQRHRPGGNLRVELQRVQQRRYTEAEKARCTQCEKDTRSYGKADEPGPTPEPDNQTDHQTASGTQQSRS